MSVNSKMTAICDEVRTLSGETDKLGLDELATHTHEANTEVDTQEELIQRIKISLQGKVTGTETPTQEKSVDITENGIVEVIPDEGYALSKVTANVDVPIPDEYVIPTGTVLITENGEHDIAGKAVASVSVPIPDGYILPNGTLDVTENGTFDVTERAEVIVSVPDREISLQDKTVKENGTYAADDGFDGLGTVVVNVASSGGGSDELTDLLTNKMTALNSNVTSIRQYAFRGATALVSIDLPKATSIATNAFYGCTKLTTVNMPLVKSIAGDVFNSCGILPSIALPSLTSGASYMFRYCYNLKTIDLAVITNIVANMFTDCRRLTALILRSPTMCTLAATSAFTSCYHLTGTTNSTYNPNGAKDCYIYVPSALVASYKTATNWSTYASQFRAIEDYPEITGG